MNLINVFVYGTLRKGFGNHRHVKEAQFLGRARTQRAYQLRQSIIPYVSEFKEEGKTQIIGEVYVVTKTQLERIDHLEGHPRFYQRKEVQVLLENGLQLNAWLYFCERGKGVINRSGDFSECN